MCPSPNLLALLRTFSKQPRASAHYDRCVEYQVAMDLGEWSWLHFTACKRSFILSQLGYVWPQTSTRSHEGEKESLLINVNGDRIK